MAKSAAPLLLLGGAFLLLAGGKKKKGGSGGSSVANTRNFYSVNSSPEWETLTGRGALRGGVVVALLTGTGDAQLFGAMKGQAAVTPHIKFVVARGPDAKRLALEDNQATGPGLADPNGALVVAFRPSQNPTGDPMTAYMANVSPLVKNVRSGKSPGPAMSVGSAVAYIEEETGKPSTSTYPGGGGPGSGTPSTGGEGSESGIDPYVTARQKGLKILGYTEVGPATGKINEAYSAAIKLFQRDWNGLMAYLGSIGSPAVGNAPYTDADEDGVWGGETQARYNKAMHEFGDPPVQAEDLMMSFNSFRDLIVELRTRT